MITYKIKAGTTLKAAGIPIVLQEDTIIQTKTSLLIWLNPEEIPNYSRLNKEGEFVPL